MCFFYIKEKKRNFTFTLSTHLLIFFICQDTIGELHRRACEIFDLSPEQVIPFPPGYIFLVFLYFVKLKLSVVISQVFIWDYFSHQKHALMNDMEKTLDDANIQMDQDVGDALVLSI